MKIALVSYDISQGKTTGLYPPLHLCNLGTSLKNAGYDVRVFDYAGLFSDMDSYLKEIKDFNPAIIGLTCFTPYVKTFYKITKRIREFIPKAVMVAGGAHPTVWPEWTLENMPHFDYAMRGECDNSIVTFAKMIDSKLSESDVPGLVYRSDSKILINAHDVITDINTLPQVDRGLLDKYYKQNMYWDMAAKGKLDMMISSRGCPYSCSFCFKLETKFRFRSAEHVLEEFDSLKRRGVKSIHIQDDAFTANKIRTIAVCNKLIDLNYNFELKVRSRVNSADEEMLALMRRAGVRQIVYGIESGSQKVLDSMNKKTTVDMNAKAIALTKQAGIACYAEIMIGMPGEDKTTIDETIQFLLKTRPIVGHVPVLYPLPGTKVYEDAKRNGTMQGDWAIDGENPWVKLPWTENYSDIMSESRRISRTIQRDPLTILYFLRHHLPRLSIRQIKFLFNHAIRYHIKK